MRAILLLLFVALSCDVAEAQVSVEGYYRKDGTYVRPHMRSSPDGIKSNNWSYPGNRNPYTGQVAGGRMAASVNFYSHYAAQRAEYYRRKKAGISTASKSQSNSFYGSGDDYAPSSPSGYLPSSNSGPSNPKSRSHTKTTVASAKSGYIPRPMTDEERAASQLRLAKQLLRNGKPLQAAEWMERILVEYPYTAAAAEAREILQTDSSIREAKVLQRLGVYQ